MMHNERRERRYPVTLQTRPLSPEVQARLKQLQRVLCWNCGMPVALGVFNPIPGEPLTVQCKKSNCGVTCEVYAVAQEGVRP